MYYPLRSLSSIHHDKLIHYIYYIQTYSSSDRVEKMVTPDEIIQVTRRITMATSKAVAAGNSGHQDDIISAANVGRMATSDLLKHCKVHEKYLAASLKCILPSHFLFLLK